MQNKNYCDFKSKLTTKLITLFLTLLIVFFAVPSIVYAEAAEALGGLGSDEEASALLSESENEESPYGYKSEMYEVKELREENVKHFRLEDGSYVAAQYPEAVHIKDENGAWNDIDNTIYDLITAHSTLDGRIKLSKKINGNGKLFSLQNGNKKITLSLSGANKGVLGEVTNNTDAEEETKLQKMMNLEKLSSSVIYRDILSGVDLEYLIIGKKIKENIIIKEKADEYSYSFALELNGLSAAMQEDGSIALTDEGGAIEYVIPAPVIFDADNTFGSAAYTLTEQNGNGKYILTVTADAEWMNSSERSFPVTLDPAICPPNSTVTDLYITSADANYNNVYSDYLPLSAVELTSYWKINSLSFIPSNVYISNAILAMSTDTVSEGYVGIYIVTSAWDSNLTYAKTQNSTPEGTLDDEMLSYSYVQGNEGEWFAFDVTEAVKGWYSGSITNYGLALKYIQGNGVFFHSVDSEIALNRPCLQVSYVNQYGLESYNSYSSHGIGGVASGNVNLATGNLVIDIPLLTSTNSIMPYGVSLVYDGAKANKALLYSNSNVPYTKALAPYGFKWSMQQSVIKRTYTNELQATKNLYIWCDADGTEHHFFEIPNADGTGSGIYQDNDGLGLKLQETSSGVTIKSKDKTVYTFSSVAIPSGSGFTGAWVLSSISDKNSNKIIFTYDSSTLKPISIKFAPKGNAGWEIFRFVYATSSSTVPTVIYDSLTERGVFLSCSSTYSGIQSASYSNYLRRVTYVKGSSSYSVSQWSASNEARLANLYITYLSSAGHINNVTETASGATIAYSYFSAKKVSAVTEKNSSTAGQRLVYTYGVGYTDVRSSGTDDVINNTDDIITRYTFDSYGRAISIYSRNAEGTKVYNGTVGTYEEENENAKNNIKETISIGVGSMNYLVNGGFEDSLDAFSYWNTTSGVSARNYITTDGTKEAKISVTASSTEYLQQIVTLDAGTYTLSLDLSSEFANEVEIGAKILNALNGTEIANISFAKNEKQNDYRYGKDVKRVYESFTVTTATYYQIRLYATGSSAMTGTAYVYLDNVMLVKGSGMAEYNLVQCGDFESNSLQVSVSDVWENIGSQNTLVQNTESLLGTSIQISSNGVSTANQVKQRMLEVPGGFVCISKNKFLVSGYGKAIGAVIGTGAKFEIRIEVGYSDLDENGNQIVDSFSLKFNPYVEGWQFVSDTFDLRYNGTVLYIDVICDMSGHPSAYGYFDNISIVDASNYDNTEYSYYPNGNLAIVKELNSAEYYVYDEDDNLIRKANSSGMLYEYVYNDYGNLTQEILCDYTSSYIDDNGRLAYPITEENHDSLIEKTPQLSTIYALDSHGLIVKIITQSYSTNGDLENPKIISGYNYDLASRSAFYGALKNEFDQIGNTTYYFYDITSMGMVSASVDGESGNGTAVYTDVWGKVEEVLPVINGSSTGYTPETTTESVNYLYNSKNQLSAIITDSTSYAFTYDTYGNRSSIATESSTIASYEYNSNNGKLKKITYGNGFVVEYVYNEVDNVSEICYTVNGTRSVVYKYHYTESGLLHRVDDVRSGKSTVYNYDKNDRLRFVTEYDTEDMSNDFSVYTWYKDDKLTTLSYMLSYQSGTSFYDKDVYTTYTYDSLDRLNSEELNLSNTLRAETTYTYDRFQRVNNTELNFEGTFILDTDFTFTEKNTTSTSTQVKTYKTTVNNTATTYTYTYDSRGNITDISINGTSQYRYVYDNLGQLIREDNVPKGKTYVYNYDTSGNIVSKYTYNLTAANVTPSGSAAIYNYTYGNAWGDLLTDYNGNTITYDAVGNPLRYHDERNFTWEGRNLVSATYWNKSLSFTYNDEGIRTSKTVNGVTTNYYLDGSRIIAEETNGNITYYLYDSTGIIGFQYHASTYGANTWDTYFYEKNLQGDIVAIYNSNGTILLSYTYDAWGNFTKTRHNSPSAVVVDNPFTYRGYYYDKDIALYYLNARYYDRQTGRWISPEPNVYSSAFDSGSGLIGHNVYAYCANNPVNFSDPSGEFILTALIATIVAGAVIGGAVGGTVAYNSAKSSGLEGSDLLLATAEGVGKGALIGGAAGALVGATGGAIVAYGASSVAATAAITSTATIAAKAYEVSALQEKKSISDGDNGWQIANDCINSVFSNGEKILLPALIKSDTTMGTYLASNMAKHNSVSFKSYLKSTGGVKALSYFSAVYAWCHTAYSSFCVDPIAKANERGYNLR